MCFPIARIGPVSLDVLNKREGSGRMSSAQTVEHFLRIQRFGAVAIDLPGFVDFKEMAPWAIAPSTGRLSSK